MILKFDSPSVPNVGAPSGTGSGSGSSASASGAKKGMGTATKVLLVVALGVGLYFGYTKIIKPMLDKKKQAKEKEEEIDD